ncbi:MAG: ShlB/FhaC/HecB family hemolysin secretion/activation protein [Betaproteobacteria bacterium]|nr:ShlB/FhaC/HecB family hemolysin secretion/activation protein [Betaproteobacteria bacterium]NBY05327.1 ShlB/FhaC/HecB family hemolysin secretion/activation protein [Betaproteobacteria bacterium]
MALALVGQGGPGVGQYPMPHFCHIPAPLPRQRHAAWRLAACHWALGGLGWAWVAIGWAQSAAPTTPGRYDQWVQYPPKPVNPAMPSPLDSSDKKINWVRFQLQPTNPAPAPATDSTSAKPGALTTSPEPSTTATAAAPIPAAPEVPVIKAFEFNGNGVFSASDLNQVLQPVVGEPLALKNLEKIVALLDQHYASRGRLGRTEIPPQDMTDGLVRIEVREGRFARAVIEPTPHRRIPPALAVELVETAQPKGEVVSLDALDRATLLLSELPGVQAQMSLRPGENEGETEAVIRLDDAPSTEGSLAVDNAVVSATGSTRTVGQISHHGAWGRAETLSLIWMHTEGSDYLKLGYSEPVGSGGMRLGLNVSGSQYQLVSPQYVSLNPSGPSNSIGLDLSVPWLRSRMASASLQWGYEHKNFRNDTTAGLVSQYKIDLLSASLLGQRSDSSMGGGEWAGSVQTLLGQVDLNGSPNQAADALSAQTAGAYAKLRAMASRVQRLNPRQSVVATWQGQLASKNLDGSEKFFMGGSQGVRAYPTNEGGGSQGQSLNLEWQQLFNPNGQRLTLSAFYDVATIDVNKFNDFTGGASLNTYALQGGGLWMGGPWAHGWGAPLQWRLTWSRRIGTNPMASANGLDQDGSYRWDRLWFNFSQPF